jgi:hypothetical protein
VGDKDESLAPHICCVTCVRLLTGWVINAILLIIQLLLLFNIQVSPPNPNTQWNILICHMHTVKSCLQHSLWKIWPSDHNSDFDEDHGQQEGDNVDCDLTFEARCSLSEPHLTQGNLKNPVCDLILSKQQAELLHSRLKGGIFSTKIMKFVSFVWKSPMKIWNYFLKRSSMKNIIGTSVGT